IAKYAGWQLRLLQRRKDLEGRAKGLGQLGPAVGPSPAVDQMAVGKAYFRAADYEQARAAFQRIPLEHQEVQDGLLVQYMIATCLRNQGKLDEAMRLYSEIVNAKLKGDETVAKYASWQLQLMQWQKDLRVRAEELKMEQPTSTPGSPAPP
ncbi:MAG: tetratricopeptide repeat protein, partial [Planctomycetota bacterium]|nr:tetratricopeptide repeat protein [Planctomycetota bacterium]